MKLWASQWLLLLLLPLPLPYIYQNESENEKRKKKIMKIEIFFLVHVGLLVGLLVSLAELLSPPSLARN